MIYIMESKELFVIFTVVILAYLIHDNSIKPQDIPDVKWPFLNLLDKNGKKINMLCVRGPIGEKEKPIFQRYLDRGIKFIGCSSYLSYPAPCLNKNGNCHNERHKFNGKNIEEYVLGWAHCFKEPDKYIKGDIPKILISESDFNSESNKPNEKIKIEYDFITIQPNDNDKCEVKWHGHNKNWPLAEKAIKVLVDELNLKGLIVGRGDCPVNVKKKENIETTHFLNFHKLMDKIRASRFILVPNFEDASPRVIAESLSLDTPIFVNENILGGWKYVNNETGLFFNENNIKKQAEKLLKNIQENNYKPRENYLTNFGEKNAGKRFRDFLKEINPELSDCELVKFKIS